MKNPDRSPPRRARYRPGPWLATLALSVHLAAGLGVWAAAPAAVAAEPADAREPPPPVYRTRMPPPLTLKYHLHRGGLSGRGELNWQLQGERYKAQLEGRVLGLRVLTWASEGLIDDHGIAPLKFTDERRGKKQLTASFQRPQGRIVYSGSSTEHPLVPGAQDRLSWMVQIGAVALADPHRLDKGQRVSFFVSGARGDGDAWSFLSQGPQSVSTPSGTVQAVKLLREPRKEHDTRVEVWLDPARHYLPVRARMISGKDNDVFELLLEE